MDLTETKDEIRAEIAKVLELEPSEIDDQADFVEDLGMDSLQALELLVNLEKRYKISISEEALRQFTNLLSVLKTVSAAA